MSDQITPNCLPGKILTFYSHKGGVGRSMALANVGVLLALSGKKVLLVDWDLEAPGLEVYFRNATKLEGDPSSIPGILDLLEAKAEEKTLDWNQCILKANFLNCSLDIISAGSRTQEYRKRVQNINWLTLFEKFHLGNYINELREQWRCKYDFILIDSRTGITDIGDICTILLPDILVLIFISNYQNIEGIKNIVERAVTARNKLPFNRSKLICLPIPARDEAYNEYEKAVEWKNIYAQEFGYLYHEWLPKEVTPNDALSQLFIPYVANWSFGERIPVLESERETSDPTTIGAAYIRISRLIAQNFDWYAAEGSMQTLLQGTQIELQRSRAKYEEQLSKSSRLTTLAIIAVFALILVYVHFLDEKPSQKTSYFIPGDNEAEKSSLLNSVAIKKPDIQSDILVGRLLLDSGNVDRALKIFDARKSILLELRGQQGQTDSDNKREINHALGETHISIGDAQEKLGNLTEALTAYYSAQQFYESVTGKRPPKRELSLAFLKQGEIYEKMGNLKKALDMYIENREEIENLLEKDVSENKDLIKDRAISYGRISDIYYLQGKFAFALSELNNGEKILEESSSNLPSKKHSREFCLLYIKKAKLLMSQGDLFGAKEILTIAEGILLNLIEADPDNLDLRLDRAQIANSLSEYYRITGKRAEALEKIKEYNEIVYKLLLINNSNTSWQEHFARSISRTGFLLIEEGNLKKAEENLNKSKDLYEKLVQASLANVDYRHTLSYQYKRLGILEQSREKYNDAIYEFDRAISTLNGLINNDTHNIIVDWKKDLMEINRLKSEALKSSDKPEEALKIVEENIVSFQKIDNKDEANFYWNREYALNIMQLIKIKNSLKDTNGAMEEHRKIEPLIDELLQRSPDDAELIAARNFLYSFRLNNWFVR